MIQICDQSFSGYLQALLLSFHYLHLVGCVRKERGKCCIVLKCVFPYTGWMLQAGSRSLGTTGLCHKASCCCIVSIKEMLIPLGIKTCSEQEWRVLTMLMGIFSVLSMLAAIKLHLWLKKGFCLLYFLPQNILTLEAWEEEKNVW